MRFIIKPNYYFNYRSFAVVDTLVLLHGMPRVICECFSMENAEIVMGALNLKELRDGE